MMSEKENTTTGGTCCRDIEHLRRPNVSNKGRSEQLETESGHFSISIGCGDEPSEYSTSEIFWTHMQRL
ncbi:unnamed protein product [Rhizophagus irregularis]|nr:unnamed protein product [Rhizophagus irregularis]